MTTNPQQAPLQSPETWSAIAAGYAEEFSWHGARYAEEALRIVAPKPTDHVLDVGAGPGTLSFVAARLAAKVTAIDFSPGMIEQLRARADREGLRNVEAAVMDVQALTFDDASFDVAFALFVLMFVDRARTFRELHRVLRPGGRVLIATWSPIDRRPMMKVGFDALAEAIPGLPPMSKGDLQDPTECVREMSDAGFRSVATRTFDAPLHVPSAEDYLRVMERSGAPLALLKKRLGDEAWTKASERLLEALRRRIPEGGVSLGAEAILTSGER